MDWQAAKDSTVRYWRDLRESLDELDEVQLLSEINAVNDLCEKAKEESAGEMDRCSFCLAYQQFGGCMGISLKMSECVVDGRFGDLRQLVDEFIDRLEASEIPDEPDSPHH